MINSFKKCFEFKKQINELVKKVSTLSEINNYIIHASEERNKALSKAIEENRYLVENMKKLERNTKNIKSQSHFLIPEQELTNKKFKNDLKLRNKKMVKYSQNDGVINLFKKYHFIFKRKFF